MKNKKSSKRLLSGALSLMLSFALATAAFAEPPAPPSGGGGPNGNSTSSVTWNGATTISSSTTESGKTYASTTANQNALLVTGGTSAITNPTVTKSGSPSGRSDDYDFYGTNAAVMVNDGATLTISGGKVTTNGSYANAVYAHGTGKINISGTVIETSQNNSGGVMVTGGGTLNASNLTITTSGGSSAAIRSDRGGGTLTVNGGSYTTNGSGSPAIYCTANITVSDATLTSNQSEGVVVEGGNSVTLNNVTLTDTNSKLNGESTTYKNIFLYQSMSGDASNGGGSFTATNSKIVTNKGDSFYVTNNTATITLKNNTIVNNDSTGYFLRAQAESWGKSGSNGGDVTLVLDDQSVTGDIYIDNISTLTMVLKNGSSFTGTINGANTAKSIALSIDATSSATLTGNSYVTSLTNQGKLNQGGYTLTTGEGTSNNSNGQNTTSEQNSKGETPGNGQTPPAKPDGGNNTAGNGQTPPDKPDGRNNATGNSQTPPDKPDGSNNATDNGQTAPDKPNSNNNTNGNGQTPPDKPDADSDLTRTAYLDIPDSAWYRGAVDYVTANGLMSGTGNGKFAPESTFTRVQLMTVLARMDGETISGSGWKTAAKEWAIKSGVSDGKDLDGAVTREQFATMLYRYSVMKGFDVSANGSLASFTDGAEVSAWADNAMRWAVGAGIMQGYQNKVTPTTVTNRATAATMLMRYCEGNRR